MPAPKADPAPCDAPGCGHIATLYTDGTEEDSQAKARPELKPRPAIPRINVCDRHENWPHSNDAQAFALTEKYRGRK
jgi:hypothetical protein